MTGTTAGVCGLLLVLIVLLYIQALNKWQQDVMQKKLDILEKMYKEKKRSYDKIYESIKENLGS